MSETLPPSVSTEFTPESFGAGTRRTTTGNKVVYEVHADRRRAGTSLRSRIHHITSVDSKTQATTLVLTPGDEYQTILIKNTTEPVTRVVGVNGTHVKMEVRDAEGNVIESAKLGFSGTKLDTAEESQMGAQLSLFEMPQPAGTEQPLTCGIEQSLVPHTLPSQISQEQVLLLSSVGELMRNPQQQIPAEKLISLSELFLPTTQPSYLNG